MITNDNHILSIWEKHIGGEILCWVVGLVLKGSGGRLVVMRRHYNPGLHSDSVVLKYV